MLRDRNGLRTETHITLRDDAREDTAWLQIYGRSATLQALWYKRQRGRVLLRSDKTRQDQAGRQADRQTDRQTDTGWQCYERSNTETKLLNESP